MSLIMAYRYRQRVLPLIAAIEKDGGTTTLLNIERQIGSIEGEALQLGFPLSGDPIDAQHSPMLDAIDDEPDRKQALLYLEEYVAIRKEIITTVQDVRSTVTPTTADAVRPEIVSGLKRIQDLNGPFIALLIRELARQETDFVAH
jgi:hypothetical protein